LLLFWFHSAELWSKNDYKSCSLPPTDDNAADDDDDDNDDDDTSDNDNAKTDINYVIGNVLQPQNSDNTDAIIVHCVGMLYYVTNFLSSALSHSS